MRWFSKLFSFLIAASMNWLFNINQYANQFFNFWNEFGLFPWILSFILCYEDTQLQGPLLIFKLLIVFEYAKHVCLMHVCSCLGCVLFVLPTTPFTPLGRWSSCEMSEDLYEWVTCACLNLFQYWYNSWYISFLEMNLDVFFI